MFIYGPMELMDGTLERRIGNVESGLMNLDQKVSLMDRKIDYLGSVQLEMYDDQTRMGVEFKSQLEDQRKELKKWQLEVKKNMGGRLQFYVTLVCIMLWFMFMMNYWWRL